MSRKKPRYNWFIEPNNKETNDAVAELLGQNAEENLELSMPCSDGKDRDLWRVTPGVMRKMINNASIPWVDFRIFNQRGNNGQIRDVTNIFTKKKKRVRKGSRKKK